MKFILPLALALTASAWGMETKTKNEPHEKEAQLFPIGSLVLKVDKKTFAGKAIDDVAHGVRDLDAMYTGKHYRTKAKIERLEDKLNPIPGSQAMDINIHHYYTSKLASLKNKLAEYEKTKNRLNALPHLFNRALLSILKHPQCLIPCFEVNGEQKELLYYDISAYGDSPEFYALSKLPLMENQYPLLRQLNLAEVIYSEKDRKTWEKIMSTFEDSGFDEAFKRDILNPQDDSLYLTVHFLSNVMKRLLPEETLKAIGSLKDKRTQIIERAKKRSFESKPLEQTISNTLKTINETLQGFQKDIEELYNQLPKENQ